MKNLEPDEKSFQREDIKMIHKITKILPENIKKVIIQIIWWVKNTMCYFFLDPHRKAYYRWRLLRGEKKRYTYDLNESSVVFDVGGYQGDFSDGINKRYNPIIYTFEPVKEFADNIIERFNGDENVHVYNIGLSDSTRVDKIHLSKDGSSLYENGENVEFVNMKDIVEFIDEKKITTIDLLKLNIEGGEYAILDRLFSSGYIDKVKYVQVQFHDVSTKSYDKMVEQIHRLEKTHFLMWKCRPFVWESWEKR